MGALVRCHVNSIHGVQMCTNRAHAAPFSNRQVSLAILKKALRQYGVNFIGHCIVWTPKHFTFYSNACMCSLCVYMQSGVALSHPIQTCDFGGHGAKLPLTNRGIPIGMTREVFISISFILAATTSIRNTIFQSDSDFSLTAEVRIFDFVSDYFCISSDTSDPIAPCVLSFFVRRTRFELHFADEMPLYLRQNVEDTENCHQIMTLHWQWTHSAAVGMLGEAITI